MILVLPFLNAIIGALILFVLFQPIYRWFNKKVFKKSRVLSALATMFFSVLIVIVPLFIVGNIVVFEVANAADNTESLDMIAQKIQEYTGEEIEVDRFFKSSMNTVFSYLRSSFTKIIVSLTNILLSLIMAYFLFYYLLVDGPSIVKNLKDLLPFRKRNASKIINEFIKVTKAMVLGIGVVAVVEGILITAGFLIFGIQGAFLWGFVATVLAFLPVIGASFVYIPAGIILLAMNNYAAGIGIILWGLLLVTTTDYFLKPVMAKKLADIHPLITLVGVFVGVSYFGIFGVILGPLILSYLFLVIRLFREEYVFNRKT